MSSLLIVEDEDPLRLLLSYNFEAEGFAVRATGDGEEVETLVSEQVPDVILLDWMLPGLSGIEICRRLRQRPDCQSVPIIMLTARGEESERIRGLSTGADDYVVKPFSVPELIARVKAVLRRANPDAVAEQLSSGDLVLDRSTRRVFIGDKDIDLSPTEFKLLEFLMQSPGRVFSRGQLLDSVWGHDIYVDERTVDVHVGRLRKTLKKRGMGKDPIRTVRGTGYSFDERYKAKAL